MHCTSEMIQDTEMKGSCAVATDKIKSAASETDLSPVEAADRDSPPAQKKKIYWLSETKPFVIKDFNVQMKCFHSVNSYCQNTTNSNLWVNKREDLCHYSSDNKSLTDLQANTSQKNNNRSFCWSFTGLGLYKKQIRQMTRASAAAASPTDGSEFPWREILFVWAVQAGRVFQQDIPTEGEVNYEQTLHKRIWSWI